MPVFEVFIPARDEGGSAVTLHVQARNWMQALSAGMSKTGESNELIKNLMVDVKDADVIEVTDPIDGRVFRLQEIDHTLDDDDEPDEFAPPSTLPPAIAASDTPSFQASAIQPPPRPKTVEIVSASERFTKAEVGRPRSLVPFEKIRGELLTRCGAISRAGASPKETLNKFLDLALEYVECDSGSVILKLLGREELYFAAARGPKAKEVLQLTVPAGAGIAGFCTLHAVALAISDVQRDPRFYADISKKLAYATHSILCGPLAYNEECFGVLELINRRESPTFTEIELATVEHLGSEIALYLHSQLMGR